MKIRKTHFDSIWLNLLNHQRFLAQHMLLVLQHQFDGCEMVRMYGGNVDRIHVRIFGQTLVVVVGNRNVELGSGGVCLACVSAGDCDDLE